MRDTVLRNVCKAEGNDRTGRDVLCVGLRCGYSVTVGDFLYFSTRDLYLSMSDTVYAAALGLVIPVLGISVCRKLWRQGRAALRGRKSGDGSLLSIGFAVQVSLLLGSCYTFGRLASSMGAEDGHFDPYLILELPTGSRNSSLIRSQFRRLSLKHHPDKNPGNRRAAEARFHRVAKAYKALSDPNARRNWEMYGHPDGYQPWTYDLALPGWLRPGQDCSNETLALYAMGYLVAIVGIVVSARVGLGMLDPIGGSKEPALKITEEDVKALLNDLDETSSSEDVIECLAACPQLCSEDRRSLAEGMQGTMNPILSRLVERGADSLASPATQSAPSKKPSRGGKGKRGGKVKVKGKGKGKGGGADDKHGSPQGEVKVVQGEEVVEEFFTHGRQGEGNRRSTRTQPEMSAVVTHNLVVLLSALYREGVAGGDATSLAVAAQVSGSGADRTGGDDAVDATVMDEVSGGSGEATADGAGGDDDDGTTEADQAEEEVAVSRKRLAQEHELLFGLAEPLLDECLKVAARTASPRLFATVIETKALLRRRLWSSDDPGAVELQEREADVDLDAAVPRIKVEKLAVETWGESQIAIGDTVTATLTILREHASQYRGFRRRRPQDGFLSRGEPWWVLLAAGKGCEALIGATTMLVEDLGSEVAECKIKFQAPRKAGIVHLTAMVKSPVFVGVDREGSGTMRVFRHDELRDDNDAGDW